MILLLQAGQLGNQLFQYIGLKKYFPKKKIIFLSHNNNIQPLFDNLDDNFIFVKKISLSFFQILQKLIIFLIKIRFLGVIYEDLTVKNYKITIKRGLFWGILVCYSNYFQHSDAITQIDSLPILKPEIRKKAFNWINQKKINIKKNKIVFIHIRRGHQKNSLQL